MSASTTFVNGTQGLIAALAASGSWTELDGVNESGCDLLLYIDAQTVPFIRIPGTFPYNTFVITGAMAGLQLDGQTEGGPLRVRITTI